MTAGSGRGKTVWFSRRFFEFRMGYATYIVLPLQVVNFTIIAYFLFIDRVEFLKLLFPEVYIFLTVFVLTLIPFSIFLGHYIYRRIQLRTDVTMLAEQNPILSELLNTVRSMDDRLIRIEEMTKSRHGSSRSKPNSHMTKS